MTKCIPTTLTARTAAEINAERVVALEQEVARLRQFIAACGQWCTDACCEFKKDARAIAPPIDQFADNFEKMVERK